MRTYSHAAQVLTELLAREQIDAAELSRRTGIDAGILRSILCGRRTSVSTRNLMALAHYFGFSLQELIDRLA